MFKQIPAINILQTFSAGQLFIGILDKLLLPDNPAADILLIIGGTLSILGWCLQMYRLGKNIEE